MANLFYQDALGGSIRCFTLSVRSLKKAILRSDYDSGLSLSTGCKRNTLAEKELIAGWILVGDHSV